MLSGVVVGVEERDGLDEVDVVSLFSKEGTNDFMKVAMLENENEDGDSDSGWVLLRF